MAYMKSCIFNSFVAYNRMFAFARRSHENMHRAAPLGVHALLQDS
ncbi:hypothetical protein [Burkholderia ubonensis]|nr:hypothetical protein [Burkholderia ubonensis]